MSALILRNAFNFIDNGNNGQAGAVSSTFHRTRIGLESLASLTILYTPFTGVLITPKKNLSYKGLVLLIERMKYLNPVVDFMLDLSKWGIGELPENAMDDNLFKEICNLSRLRALTLPEASNLRPRELRLGGFSFLPGLPAHLVPALSKRPWNPSNADFVHLKALSCLRALNFSYCNYLTDAELENLTASALLQVLNLSHCPKITDAGLENLTACHFLKALNLSHCPKITDAGLKNLKTFPFLQTLDLSYCTNITEAGFVHLTELPSLEKLILPSGAIANMSQFILKYETTELNTNATEPTQQQRHGLAL